MNLLREAKFTPLKRTNRDLSSLNHLSCLDNRRALLMYIPSLNHFIFFSCYSYHLPSIRLDCPLMPVTMISMPFISKAIPTTKATKITPNPGDAKVNMAIAIEIIPTTKRNILLRCLSSYSLLN